MTSTQLRRTFAAVVVAVAVVITATAAAAAPARHVSNAKQQIDLSGVTLHAGDQLEILRTQLEASGEDQNVPYTIEWSTFVGGPAVLAAQTGGSVDVGFMAETPLVFAQAAGNPVKVVAASQVVDPKTSGFALVVPPDSDITKLSQLKGKKIGYSTGTITQYFLLNALKKAGLDFTDVQAINFTGLGGQAAFENGEVDAAVTSEPFLSGQLTDKKARILVTGAGLTPGFTYLVARDDALQGQEDERGAVRLRRPRRPGPEVVGRAPRGGGEGQRGDVQALARSGTGLGQAVQARSTCRSTTRSSRRSRTSRTRSSGSG